MASGSVCCENFRGSLWKFYIHIVDITMQLPFQMVGGGWGSRCWGFVRLLGIVLIAILVFVREW